MLIQDIRFNDDIYLVKPIVRVNRAVTRYRENVQETENEDVYQIREHYADRGETKKATALYYRMRNELFRHCIRSEVGLICRESDITAIEELETKFKDQVEANGFQHVRVTINVCLIRVSNANSKVYQQISEDLQAQVNELTSTLEVAEQQKVSVEENLKSVTHTVDEIKTAVKTIDIGKLARDGQFLDTIMNFDMDEDTKASIKQLKTVTSDLIQEVKDWRNDASRFDFLIVDSEDVADAPGSEA